MKDWQKVSVTFFVLLFLWFGIPVVTVNLAGQGTIFGWLISVCGILITVYMPKLVRKDGKKFAVVFITLFCMGMLWCILLTICMFSAAIQKPPENCLAVVLGCKVSENGKPSLALQSRIKRAETYLKENPKSMCIVSGGKGKDEPDSEASVMKSELVESGISPNRIIIENHSKNTEENFKRSAEIIKKNKLSVRVAVVTDDYHQFRAQRLAEKAGLKAYAVSARTPWTIFPTCYGRELLSLTNWFIHNII